MAGKTIRITTEAYNALKAKKMKDETISEVILRITKPSSLMELAGILTEKEGDRLERAIMNNRKKHAKEHERRIKKIVAALEGHDDFP
jgi:predicted CopG family antitoxin